MTILDSGRKNRSERSRRIYSFFLSVENFIETYRGQKPIAAVSTKTAARIPRISARVPLFLFDLPLLEL